MRTSQIAWMLALALACSASWAQVKQVVPTDRENQPGTTSFLGPLANSQRTYQLLINESELTNLVGMPLDSITYRLLGSATVNWPANDISYANYDIFLSRSVPPSDRSLTFANNVAGPQTQVRAGALEIPAGSFRAEGTPREFGMEIKFDTPYLYTGDHLLIELRHTGSTGTSASVDAMAATGGAAQGYGTRFSAAWIGNYAGTSGNQGNFAVIQIGAIPEPATATVGIAALGLLALRRRRRA